MTEMINTLEGIHSTLANTEKWTTDPEDRLVEINSSEPKEKRIYKIEDSLRDLWDNTECSNITLQ